MLLKSQLVNITYTNSQTENSRLEYEIVEVQKYCIQPFVSEHYILTE